MHMDTYIHKYTPELMKKAHSHIHPLKTYTHTHTNYKTQTLKNNFLRRGKPKERMERKNKEGKTQIKREKVKYTIKRKEKFHLKKQSFFFGELSHCLFKSCFVTFSKRAKKINLKVINIF